MGAKASNVLAWMLTQGRYYWSRHGLLPLGSVLDWDGVPTWYQYNDAQRAAAALNRARGYTLAPTAIRPVGK